MTAKRWLNFSNNMMSQPVSMISGGMGGIGQAIARQLAKDGHSIALLYHRSPAQEVESFLETLMGTGHVAFACDLTDGQTVARTVASIVEKFGTITNVVHAATSPLVRKHVTRHTLAEFREPFEATVFGAFNLFQAVAPIMKEKKSGAIVGLTTAAIEPNGFAGGMAGYLCAKDALRGLLREFAKELAPWEIRVNAVAPGFVPTALHSDLPERAIELALDKNPMKKLVTPEDVANVVAFLCSDRANAISGVSIPVTYGEVMSL